MTNETVKFSLSLPDNVYRALADEAKAHSRDEQDFMRWLLIDHTLSAGYLSQKESKMLAQYRAISNRAAEIAQELISSEGFTPDITFRTIKRCQNDADWIENYRAYVGGDEFDEHNPKKGSLNQNIGYRIKRAIGAEVETGPYGNKVVTKVQNEIIKSFTRLKMPH